MKQNLNWTTKDTERELTTYLEVCQRQELDDNYWEPAERVREHDEEESLCKRHITLLARRGVFSGRKDTEV